MPEALILPCTVPCWCGEMAVPYGKRQDADLGDDRFAIIETSQKYRCPNGHRLRYGVEHEINYLDGRPFPGVISATNGGTLGGDHEGQQAGREDPGGAGGHGD